MKKNKSIVGLLVAASVGFVAGEATDAAIASPMPVDQKKTVSVCLSVGQATAVRNILKSAVCDEFEELFDLGPGECNADFLKDSWVHQPGIEECTSGWKTQTEGTFPGDWRATLP